MNKKEKKIDAALQEYENFVQNPKHDCGWIYRKLHKWSKKKKISKKNLQDFCARLMVLVEDSIYD